MNRFGLFISNGTIVHIKKAGVHIQSMNNKVMCNVSEKRQKSSTFPMQVCVVYGKN